MDVSKTSIALAALLALTVAGCGGGGGGGGGGKKKSALPPEVEAILDDIETAVRSGTQNLPVGVSCGIVSNPLPSTNFTNLDDIAGQADHSGTVAQATFDLSETRSPDGTKTITATISDTGDPGRIFLVLDAVSTPMQIDWSAPPLGAKDFLAPDGTGQSFALLRVRQGIAWTKTFQNDPAGPGGTLVDFSGNGAGAGPVPISLVPDGTVTGTADDDQTYLFEFAIAAGPSGNTACVENVWQVRDGEVFNRDDAGVTIDFLEHRHQLLAGAASVPALEKDGQQVIAVAPDPDPLSPVVDAQPFDFVNGQVLGGIDGFPAFRNYSRVSDPDNALILLDDGVSTPTDGDWSGDWIYRIEMRLDIAGGPGGLGDSNVDVSIVTLETSQAENPAQGLLDHPTVDELLLYGEYASEMETGIIIFR